MEQNKIAIIMLALLPVQKYIRRENCEMCFEINLSIYIIFEREFKSSIYPRKMDNQFLSGEKFTILKYFSWYKVWNFNLRKNTLDWS